MSDTVLIADSHGERGRRVARACASYGIEVHLVTHGAAALEYALSDKPVAMVAQLELPLIDGARLAEILQNNPRTRGLAVLFVGDEPARETVGSGPRRAQVIPGHADPDTIARFIEALLQKRRPGHDAGAVPESAPGVEGQLAQISLTELIELFHVNRKTGIVELRQGGGRRAQTGRVHLQQGEVVQARTGHVEGEKALFRLLGWRRGSFSFREDAAVDSDGIDRPTRALLRESQRHTRDWERFAADLPSPHDRVSLLVSLASLPNSLHPLTREVLSVVEREERVQDVLDRSTFPDYHVLRTLQTLVRRGMVELSADAAPCEGSSYLASALVSRLRDWLESGRPRDSVTPDAKVAVFSATPEAHRSLLAVLGRLPGCEMAPRGAGCTGVGLWPALRLPVDDEVALEIFGVPAGPRYAPVWPLAAHGALASLFVHAGDLGASLETLRDALRVVGERPRARTFHVLLGDKDRAGVDALCERLGVFDDRRVMALPLDPPEGASSALRELLARLMP